MPSELPTPFSDRFVHDAVAPTRFHSTAERTYRRVITDSRSVQAGDLFVALKGDNFDGHAFIGKAIQAGATGVLCEEGFQISPELEVNTFFVRDTLTALRRLAGAYRDLYRLPVVVVAGSVGKTTTKEFLAALLSGRYGSVLKTEQSQNGFLGIPLTLLRLCADHRAAVIEVGIDAPHAMLEHLRLVKPNGAIVTTIAEEHLDKLKDLKTVAEEECLPLRYVARAGQPFAISLDDTWIAPLAEELKGGVTYSLEHGEAGKQKLRGHFDPTKGTLTVSGGELHDAEFLIPLPGRHNAANLLGALAMASALGLSEKEMREGLKRFTPPPARSELVTLPNGIEVLCDYYNASPASTRAALETLSALNRVQVRRNLVCLGDMLELGPDERKLHADLAQAMENAPVDRLYLFGPLMRVLSERLGASPRPLVHHTESMEELIQQVKASLKPSDRILIKGSHGMRMERLFQALSKSD